MGKPAVENASARACQKRCRRFVGSMGGMCSVMASDGSGDVVVRPRRLILRGGM